MRRRVIAWGTGLLVFLSACVAETITMPQEPQEIYVVDQASVERINDRLDTIEHKIDNLSFGNSVDVVAYETVSHDESTVNGFTEPDIMLMACVVQAEYGNGTELDKRMIVSVILNRLENTTLSDFKNLTTVEAVVKQKNQFVIASQDSVTLETLNCVYKEIRERTDNRVLWFSSGGYLPYGDPIIKVNRHYFSGIKGDLGE